MPTREDSENCFGENLQKEGENVQNIKNENLKKIGLYIHIPFCEKKCDYCNFVSFCCSDVEKIKYIECLIKEISIQGKNYAEYEVDSIFIGGGTPSCLPNGAIYKILNSIFQNFKVWKKAEITIESNPNSLTIAKLMEYKKSKINRLSVGLQCYNNRLLKLIGRLHNKKQFDEAINRAKLVGFSNINVDLILGVPKQKLLDIKIELKHLLKLNIPHISAYGLIVEDGTKLAQNLKAKVYKLPSENLQVKMYDYTKKILEKHKIFRYEVSNFSKSGYESKHNLKYWTNGEYLGLGAVSSSFVDNYRWKNSEDLSKYEQSINLGKLPKEEIEKLDKASEIEEMIMLSLRTANGID